jgi:alkanesulfonate monooxygenase SsuD/methylene tetrahydromethanopterin reductase-like flavin-dependent oxidoreductase (luciferase family)
MLRAAQTAERYGFDSLWLRDHIVYHPHGYESPDRTFYEPIVTIAALGAAVPRIAFGTASLIMHRHPLYLAQELACISRFIGPNRLIPGFGLGGMSFELDVVGMGQHPKPDLHREQVEIIRRAWTGQRVDHSGGAYQFEDADLQPTPLGEIPIWYCGGSAAAVRRAVEYCDGWLPGHAPFRTVEARMARMRRLCEEAGRPMLPAGTVAFTSPGRTREEGIAKFKGIENVLANANRNPNFVKPESGRFESPADLAGGVLVGSPSDIVADVRGLQQRGMSLTVFDLRYRFGDFDDCLAMLGEEVLPELRRRD